MKALVLFSGALLVSTLAVAESNLAGVEEMQADPGAQEQVMQDSMGSTGEQVVNEAPMMQGEASESVVSEAAEAVNQVTSPEVVPVEPAAEEAMQPEIIAGESADADQPEQAANQTEKKWWQFWAK